MRIIFFTTLWILFFALSCKSPVKDIEQPAIHNGIAWYDQHHNEVNAHGACVVKDGDKYYLFGEYKSDTTNAFVGFSCYSSTDLTNWQFEKIVLPMQASGLLGPNRVGERVKVMKCPSTGEYVMYMHTDDMKYMDPNVGYATCQTIDGDYQFQGALLFEGEHIHKWDLGTYQDDDDKGYLLTHEGFIYELANDYKSVTSIVASNEAQSGESPAMFKKNGTYFWLFSNKTSWERNDNYYLTSSSLSGPWNRKGYFAPEGTLTWNSQCSFVLPIHNGNDTLLMYMGDRWSYPKQGSAATQVWLPITVDKDEMSIPSFYESWHFDKDNRWYSVNKDLRSIKNEIKHHGDWNQNDNNFKSKEKGDKLSVSFQGKQIAVKGLTNNLSGYAIVVLKNSQEEVVLDSYIDFYSKQDDSSLRFLSPELKEDNYTFTIEVAGEHPFWSDKRRSHYGSTENFITVEDILVR